MVVLKLHLLTLAGVALLALAGCLTPPPLPAGAPAAKPAAAPAAPDEPEKHARAFGRSARELLASTKIGWNLGNALDAPENETAWGNPPITPELLQAVAKAGFGIVRIPVTWTLHTGPAPEFTIEPAWLDRVAEVVGYARDAGLVAIINVHHDGADEFKQVEWITLNDATGAITEANNAAVRDRFVKVWTQIASRFAPYGEELLFESMNEIHDGYGQPNPKYFDIINALNQAFIDVVRATGGNNAQRHLIVPGYNTNIDHTLAGFELPKDPTPERLIVSAHYYDPYLFALQAEKHTWGKASPGNDGWGQEDFVLTQFDKLKTRFLDKGIPVILGEYGAVHQQGYEDYRRYYMEYVTKAAVDRGIVPIYWDNGGQGSGGEKSGMFDRRSQQVLHPKILEAMMRAAKQSYQLSEVALPVPAAEATAKK
jgi:aryl-phospho-beta-D-glucosidase BglC (GH1 family)